MNIDLLALNGLQAGDGIGAAVEHELNRLLKEQGLPFDTVPSNRARVDGGAISLQQKTGVTNIGGQIAAAIYRGLARGDSAPVRNQAAHSNSNKSTTS